MSTTIFAPLPIDTPGALCSHDPLQFAAQPEAKSAMTRQAASRLLFISHWKLSSESAQDEPRLRKLLGHVSVYDKTRTFAQPQKSSLTQQAESDETRSHFQPQAPSFKDFQAAIQEQLSALSKLSQAAAQLTVGEYEEEAEDDSDYDSYDGDDWSENDMADDSDDSFTDNESLEGQSSECSSPTSSCHEEEDDSDLWAVRPLTPQISKKSVNF